MYLSAKYYFIFYKINVCRILYMHIINISDKIIVVYLGQDH